MRRPLNVFELELRDRRVEATTTAAETGVWIVALSTAVPYLAIDVHSVYLGGPGLPTKSTHLLLTETGAQLTEREHPIGDLPVDVDRRGVVVDHAATVHDVAIGQVLQPVRLHVDDDMLDELVAHTLSSR